MMQETKTVDIFKLQLESKLQSLNDEVKKSSGLLPVEILTTFKNDLITLLGSSNCIEISNREHAGSASSGFFVLQITTDGLFLFESRSIKRSQYVFTFEKNQIEINKRPVSEEYIPDFIKRIESIIKKINTGECFIHES